ncbi:MAG TPA: hypothetical protein VIW92_13150, partial [Thermoanaerobaculia bacterium]
PAVTPKVVLVNMPAILGREGMGAYSFVNGLHELLRLSTDNRITQPELFYTYAAFRDGKFANASRPISLVELARRTREPESLVLVFDGETRTVKEATPASWRVPQEYDLDSAPFLEWQSGSWPWFQAYAGQPLELPLAAAPERSWVALRYLRKPGVAFRITDGAGPGLDVRVPADASPSWPFATFPLGTPRPEAFAVQPESEVWLAGLWPFSPPAAYSPESAPFLPWIPRPFPQLIVEGPLRLPLAAPDCASCTFRIEYLAERGRDFTMTLDGVARTFSFDDLAVPEWRTERLPSTGAAVVAIEPRGKSILIRSLALETGALQASRR